MGMQYQCIYHCDNCSNSVTIDGGSFPEGWKELDARLCQPYVGPYANRSHRVLACSVDCLVPALVKVLVTEREEELS